MNKCTIFTSANGAYLPKVRTLAQSVKRHVPNARFCLFLAELNKNDWLVSSDYEIFDEILSPQDVEYPDNLGWAITHTVVEYCTAVKPQIALQLLRKYQEKVYFFDPDTVIFSNLSEMHAILEKSYIMLTPHLLDPESNANPVAIRENEISALKHGIYNLGFFAVAPSEIGEDFLIWYSTRLYHYCIDNPSEGLFTDQKWCDLVPLFFPTTAIFRNKGANVASWNISKRKLISGDDGFIGIGHEKLIFYHFTGYDNGSGAAMTLKYSNNNPFVEGLWFWYAQQLSNNKNLNDDASWSMGRFKCGYKISNLLHKKLRDVYKPDIFGSDPYILSYEEVNKFIC